MRGQVLGGLLLAFCASGSAAAELSPTTRFEDGRALTATGLPLYSYARFIEPTVDLAGTWRVLRVAGDPELSLAARTPETIGRLEAEAGGAHLPELDHSSWQEVEIPSVIAAPPEVYEGTVWYRRSFDTDTGEGACWLLRFEGVGYIADVWLNGAWIGYHEGTYTPFTFDVTSHLGEHNLLAVRAAVIPRGSRDDVVPYADCDFWNYGGILRDVGLARVPETHIADLRASGAMDGELSAKVTVRATRASFAGTVHADVFGPFRGQTRPFTEWKLPERPVASHEVAMAVGAGASAEGTLRLHVGSPALWSPEDPALYIVRARIDGDELRAQTGFRTIATAPGGKLLLNGQPVRLLGAARHEEMPGRWQSVAWSDWPTVREDFARLKSLRCDFVRIGHYPAHPSSALICDQLGLAAWEEVPFYWFGGPELLASLERGIAQQYWIEMLQRDASSPSVLFWGTCNESGWQDERKRFNAALHDLAHEYDGTRLVGQSAVGSDATDATHDPLDVVGMTLYYGVFYGKDPRADTAAALRAAAERFPDKPIIATEFGAWGGDTPDGQGWQRWVFQETFAALEAEPHVAGALWWAAYDYYSPLQKAESKYHAFGLYDFSRTVRRPVADALEQAYRRARSGDPPSRPPP